MSDQLVQGVPKYKSASRSVTHWPLRYTQQQLEKMESIFNARLALTRLHVEQVQTILAHFRNKEGLLGREASLNLLPDAATALAQMSAAMVRPS